MLGLALCALSLPARARAQTPDAVPAAPPDAPPADAGVTPAEPALPPSAPLPSAPAPAQPPPSASEPLGGEPAGTPAKEKQEKEKGDDDSRSEDDSDAPSASPLTVGARLMMGFERDSERPAGGQTDPANSEYGFTVRQIRLRLKGELAEQFRANVSFDLSDAISPEAGAQYDEPPYLRTATLEYRHSRELRVRVGRFKRPFSHLELESASDLPILRRGLFNGLALEDNQWGDRAIGVMASGRFKEPKLRYYLAFMNPGWSSTLATEGLDVMGRAEWTPIKGLTLGANAAYKNVGIGNDRVSDAAYGGDVTLRLGDAHFLLESNSAALLWETGRPRALGALFMFDYVLGLSENWSLQPTFFAEYADANTDVLENESLRLAFSLNALAYSGFRVMPQVDIVRSVGDTSAANPWPESETLSLIFSLVL